MLVLIGGALKEAVGTLCKRNVGIRLPETGISIQ